MKRSFLFMGGILIVLLAACGPSAEQTTTLTAPARSSTPQPTPTITPSPTPELITERLSPVRLSGSNEPAGYLYRAFLQIPAGMVWGADGFLYIADWGGRHIVRVAKDGSMDDLPFWNRVMALQEDGPRDVAFDSQGNLYTNNSDKIFRVDGNGDVTELQGIQAGEVGSLAVSAADELYYTDRSETGALRKWDPAGNSETVVDNLPFADSMAFGLDGTLYLTQLGQEQVLKVDVTTGMVSTFTEIACGNEPCFLAVDHEGDIWVRGFQRLYQFSPEGEKKIFMVDGEVYPGGPFSWHTAAGIAFDDEGNLWIASYNSTLMRLVLLTPGEPLSRFTLEVISPGLEATDLDVGPDGGLYAPDMNTRQVYRFTPDGGVDVLGKDIPGGRTAIAVDKSGTVYLGMADGKIARLGSDGVPAYYARVLTRRMKFGADGALYAISEHYNQPMEIVRITGMDTFTSLGTQFDGISLPFGEVHISPALDTGLYLFTQWQRNLFFVDFYGQGHLIATLSELGDSGVAVMAASPVTGDIYIVTHELYKLFRISPQGNIQEFATGLFGDPWGMAVSKDGKWLYVAESGAIDKIPIPNTPSE